MDMEEALKHDAAVPAKQRIGEEPGVDDVGGDVCAAADAVAIRALRLIRGALETFTASDFGLEDLPALLELAERADVLADKVLAREPAE